MRQEKLRGVYISYRNCWRSWLVERTVLMRPINILRRSVSLSHLIVAMFLKCASENVWNMHQSFSKLPREMILKALKAQSDRKRIPNFNLLYFLYHKSPLIIQASNERKRNKNFWNAMLLWRHIQANLYNVAIAKFIFCITNFSHSFIMQTADIRKLPCLTFKINEQWRPFLETRLFCPKIQVKTSGETYFFQRTPILS